MMNVGIVIPCYNEEQRLSEKNIAALASHTNIQILLVNDGSKDNTQSLLEKICAQYANVKNYQMPTNSGKGEAVRAGLNLMSTQPLEWVGFIDADFATPANEVVRIVSLLPPQDVQVVLCSRVRLLGYRIHRKLSRHYLGRVFATLASIILKLPVYDTQCGCKFFRNTTLFRQVIEQPFQSRWVFDVEILKRFMTFQPKLSKTFDDSFLEIPLLTWRDVQGSKLGLKQMFGAFIDLLKLGFR